MPADQLQMMCCFCGQSVGLADAIEITIKPQSELDEVQSLYAHAKCLDKVLDKDVPRIFDITS
jgi:hypothetical protein